MKAAQSVGNHQAVADGVSSADSAGTSWGYESQGSEVSRATIASSATSSTTPTGTTSTSTVPAQLPPCSIAVRRPPPMDSSISSTQGARTQWSWKDASASASTTTSIENVTMWGGFLFEQFWYACHILGRLQQPGGQWLPSSEVIHRTLLGVSLSVPLLSLPAGSPSQRSLVHRV